VQLEESFFDIVSVETVPQHTPDPGGRAAEIAVEVSVTLAIIDERPGVWKATLEISGKDENDDAEPPPYRFRLRTVGFFRYAGEDLPEAEVAEVIGANGCSILYSSAREYLLLITGRAPWGQVRLPTMSFGGLGVQATSAEQS
jgi:preprotein translocase subunit SecB